MCLYWLWWKKINFKYLSLFFRLRFIVPVSMHYRLCFVTVSMKLLHTEDLSNFQTGQVIGAHLAGASVTKMANLWGVFRAAVLKVMTAYTYHGKTSSANRNSGRISKVSERGCHKLKKIVSKYRELLQRRWHQKSLIILKTLFRQEWSNVVFTNPTATVELQLLRPDYCKQR
jgi:hypothetical protein